MKKKNLIYICGICTIIVATWKINDVRKSNRRLEIAKLPLPERGKALLKENGCTSCHEPGNAYRAPVLEKLYGRTVNLTSGASVSASREYILTSILNPKAEIVVGYQGTMPAYADRFSDDEIDAFVEAMK